MKKIYYSPEITVEELDALDALCSSKLDNNTIQYGKSKSQDLLGFIFEDFDFT